VMAARTRATREGRARPSRAHTTPKALRTRRQILDCSLALFRERGFDGTSMREIASNAGLSLGSTYYHFPSKEALVLEYYRETQEAAERHNDETIEATDVFAERLNDLVDYKLEQLADDRRVVTALARTALDPSNALSPFHPGTWEIRDAAIAMIEKLVDGSDLKVHPELRPYVARFLWLYQMGILFLWLHDRSEGQARVARVVRGSQALLSALLPITAARLPGMRKTVRGLVALLRDLSFWEDPVDETARSVQRR